VVERKIDYLFTLGEFAGLMAEEALKAGAKAETVYAYNSREELAKTLKKFLSPGDLVLLKGSRGMGMEEIIKYLEN
jgi:UDP-N-acetylmuramoyl-tripeptide--D-alanyl-D-alanine ligase